MGRKKWGKGVAYPLIGDRVRVKGISQIWEVSFLYTTSYRTKYRLVPWSRGADIQHRMEAWLTELIPVPPEDLILDELAIALGS